MWARGDMKIQIPHKLGLTPKMKQAVDLRKIYRPFVEVEYFSTERRFSQRISSCGGLL